MKHAPDPRSRKARLIRWIMKNPIDPRSRKARRRRLIGALIVGLELFLINFLTMVSDKTSWGSLIPNLLAGAGATLLYYLFLTLLTEGMLPAAKSDNTGTDGGKGELNN